MPCRPNNSSRTGIAALLLVIFAATSVVAQQYPNELSQYTNAVARVQPADRVIQLERFAINAQSGPLKIDALEFVIWEYLRTHNDAHALAWAHPLADADPGNAVALALLSNDARQSVEKGSMKPDRLLAMSTRGLNALPQLRRPLGMSGAAGTAELHMKDYVSARSYLHNAVYVNPNNAQDTYALALADLNGPDKNPKEGYWYMARAVDLAQGTPQGMEMARFARAQYVKDGGSTSGWNDFLASAKPTGSPTPVSTYAAMASLPTPPPVVARPPEKAKPVQTASIKPPSVKSSKSPPAPSVWEDTTSPPVVAKRRIPA